MIGKLPICRIEKLRQSLSTDHVIVLFSQQEIELLTPIADIISKPGLRTNCMICGEEIMNQREVHQGGKILCRSCAGFSYYAVS